MNKKLPRGTLDRLWSDPGNWLPIGLYYCKDDPRIIVPKRRKALGWTINAAHTWAWVALLILILSIMVPAAYLKSINDSLAMIIFTLLSLVAVVVLCNVTSSANRHEED